MRGKLLGHMAVLFLIFEELSNLSKTIVPYHISTSMPLTTFFLQYFDLVVLMNVFDHIFMCFLRHLYTFEEHLFKFFVLFLIRYIICKFFSFCVLPFICWWCALQSNILIFENYQYIFSLVDCTFRCYI